MVNKLMFYEIDFALLHKLIIWVMHNICKVRGSNPVKKKVNYMH